MRSLVSLLLLWLMPWDVAAAELTPEMVDAYEEYVAQVEQGFAPTLRGDLWIEEAPADMRSRLRSGEIVAWPGSEDGILDIPDGLIHHWRGAAFIPGVTLETVLAIVQDYRTYPSIYDWVVDGQIIRHERDPVGERDRYWVLLRIRRSANVVTSTVDVWTLVDYRDVEEKIVTATSDADCIREVEDAGTDDERRLPLGEGRGYLWRANTYTSYLERDGGVYVDLQTVGLSRGFPPLLGWLVEPIARRIGRGSVADTLRHLRAAVIHPGRRDKVADDEATASVEAVWCEAQ